MTSQKTTTRLIWIEVAVGFEWNVWLWVNYFLSNSEDIKLGVWILICSSILIVKTMSKLTINRETKKSYNERFTFVIKNLKNDLTISISLIILTCMKLNCHFFWNSMVLLMTVTFICDWQWLRSIQREKLSWVYWIYSSRSLEF